jgi:hypothetical protein
VYASAGIGRTKTGRAVARSPFALHRLRFSDNSVEVLMADARYDYTAVAFITENLLYALRRSYEAGPQTSPFASITGFFRGLLPARGGTKQSAAPPHDLVRITPEGSQLLARDVLAFDVTPKEELVYSKEEGVFRIAAGQTTPEPLCDLKRVEQLVIC